MYTFLYELTLQTVAVSSRGSVGYWYLARFKTLALVKLEAFLG